MGVITNGSGGGGGNVRYDKTTQFIQVKDDQGWFNWRKAVRAFWDCVTNVYTTTGVDTLADRLQYSTDETVATLRCIHGTRGVGARFFDVPISHSGTLHVKGNVTVNNTNSYFQIAKNTAKTRSGQTILYENNVTGALDFTASVEAGMYIAFGISYADPSDIGYTATITDFYVD